ncbi:aldo/keto reductase [Alteromonas sp. ASW11-130]|uniref:aldo/keto reductase n=1 Tax=Alteromonas sp. ASW11-130 TaxID=3015775 RepID=UPI0022419307|nr:aldo/keto reductase [Alteromonas sp. ASW11-130]MCW8092610.1 aldo/keto reductase [Alteromonas sp. ASW11-130]
MKYHPLGRSGLNVSEVCLGTMTWGIQNTQADANEQLAMAIDANVNFIDTAEMYPTPPNEQTYGETERILGHWLNRHRHYREQLVIMSKVAGRGLSYIRNGSKISGDSLTEALDNSLARLNTDYLDVYQLHWPNRPTPHFGKHWPGSTNPLNTEIDNEIEGMRDILLALDRAMASGKIHHWGLSDDTPWGIATYLKLCDEMNIERPVSIQNEFSLLHTKDWPYLIEQCVFEHIAYLPWSPLATGILTGKYMGGERPAGSRWTYIQRQGLFRDKPAAHDATKRYQQIAERLNISSAQLALAWCKQVSGVTSTIIGATSKQQLSQNLEAFKLELAPSTLSQIDEVLQRYPVGF